MIKIAFAFSRDINYAGRIQKLVRSLLKIDNVFIDFYDKYNDSSSLIINDIRVRNEGKSFRIRKNKLINFVQTILYNLKTGYLVAKARTPFMVCHDVTPLYAGYIAKKKNPDLFLIYDCNELSLESMKHQNQIKIRFFDYVLRKTIPQCDAILQVDELRGEYLKSQYPFDINKQIIIKNFPKKDLFQPIEKMEIERNVYRTVYFGNIAADREVDKIIEAFIQLNDNYYLDIIGNGKEHYIRKIKNIALKAQHRIRILPPINQDEISNILQKYQIGFMFYRPDNLNHLYCAPNKIYEYLFNRLCIITYNLPSIRSMIIDNKVGVCINKITAENIKLAIDEIYINNYFKNITDNLLKLFTWECQEPQLLSLFERKIGNQSDATNTQKNCYSDSTT